MVRKLIWPVAAVLTALLILAISVMSGVVHQASAVAEDVTMVLLTMAISIKMAMITTQSTMP